MSSPVDVWICPLDRAAELASKFVPLLSIDELQKARRYKFKELEDSYILTRGLTRYILGAQIAMAPAAIQFSLHRWGKPFIPAHPQIFFNVSHTGSMLVCAVSRVAPVGIDVELMRPMPDAVAIAKNFFSDAEVACLAGMAVGSQERAFFECWTRKEAFIKATGEGLHCDLKSFSVVFGSGRTARFDAIENDDPAAWTLLSFEVGAGYVAALAMRAERGELRMHDLLPI